MSQANFFYPHAHYCGRVKPENLVFNANLQEFSQQVGIICSLETGGRISPAEAFQRIETLWSQLKYSKEALGIADPELGES
ncbi:hypothetical protein IFO70_39095 [Phormidium tenue FACHB-886]|nr:hypothetical protein [Phormidium tenue FACHB-886]